jgi:hypothetical protein
MLADREHIMATILDIKGKPLPPRTRANRRLKTQDARDLLKILIMLSIILTGYLLFAPSRDAGAEMRVVAAHKSQG